MHMLQRHGSPLFWGLVFIVLGVILLLNNFGVLAFDIWDYWPAIFVLFGAKLLLDATRRKKEE